MTIFSKLFYIQPNRYKNIHLVPYTYRRNGPTGTGINIENFAFNIIHIYKSFNNYESHMIN